MYPCFLWWAVFAFAALNVLVNVCKCWRLIMLFLMNQYKAHQGSMDVSMSNMAKQRKVIRIYTILSSGWFMAIIFALFTAIHIILYGVTMGITPQNVGCFTSGFNAYFIAGQVFVEGAIYVLLYVMLSIFTIIKGIYDTWGIRTEILVIPIYWLPLLAAFGIAYIGIDFKFWPERYVAANIFMVCFLIIPLVTRLVCGCLYRHDCYNSDSSDSNICYSSAFCKIFGIERCKC